MTAKSPSPEEVSLGTLNEMEPHPAAHEAKAWLLNIVAEENGVKIMRYQEAFASTALSGSRLAEICSETLRRLLNAEPVSDRYLLGLCWAIRNMEDANDE